MTEKGEHVVMLRPNTNKKRLLLYLLSAYSVVQRCCEQFHVQCMQTRQESVTVTHARDMTVVVFVVFSPPKYQREHSTLMC